MSLTLEARQANIAAGSISGRYRPLPPLRFWHGLLLVVALTIKSYGWQVYTFWETGQPLLSSERGYWLVRLVGKGFLFTVVFVFGGYRVFNWLLIRW